MKLNEKFFVDFHEARRARPRARDTPPGGDSTTEIFQ